MIGEIESITTLLPLSPVEWALPYCRNRRRARCCATANGWMARISTPSMSLSLSLNTSARGGLSPQAQAVKDILLSLVSRPTLENRELQLVS